jgi:hypothetical protein
MDTIKISVVKDREVHQFAVADYLHHEGERCKFEIFRDEQLVASFRPDVHEYLTVCSNPGNLDEELLHLIADKIESLHLN